MEKEVLLQIVGTLQELSTKISVLGTDITGIDAKIAAMGSEFDAKIAAMSSEFDAKIAAIGTGIDAKIAAMGSGIDTRITAMGTEINAKIAAMGSGIDTRITAMGTEIDAKIAAMGTRVSTLEKRVEDGFDEMKREMWVLFEQEVRSHVNILADGHSMQNEQITTLDDRVTVVEERTEFHDVKLARIDEKFALIG